MHSTAPARGHSVWRPRSAGGGARVPRLGAVGAGSPDPAGLTGCTGVTEKKECGRGGAAGRQHGPVCAPAAPATPRLASPGGGGPARGRDDAWRPGQRQTDIGHPNRECPVATPSERSIFDMTGLAGSCRNVLGSPTPASVTFSAMSPCACLMCRGSIVPAAPGMTLPLTRIHAPLRSPRANAGPGRDGGEDGRAVPAHGWPAPGRPRVSVRCSPRRCQRLPPPGRDVRPLDGGSSVDGHWSMWPSSFPT